jgi:ribosomal protein L11 methyltransferase
MVELKLTCPRGAVEALGDLLADHAGALAVTVEDADAGEAAEEALFGEPGQPPPAAGWSRSALTALFDDMAGAERGAALVLAAPSDAGDGSAAVGAVALVSITEVPDDDWVRRTQAQFTPVEPAPGFWIVPTWHEVPPAARWAMRLDPGLAFGTGTHPTTRMCLRFIAAAAAAGGGRWERVLDYGCGSGILAIAAAMLGAQRVDAVDIDPAAVAATEANAAANGVAASLCAGLPARATGRYPLVLANILASPLELLAPLLTSHVASGGTLVLAGLLTEQEERLRAAYAPGVALRVIDAEDGWLLMAGTRADG